MTPVQDYSSLGGEIVAGRPGDTDSRRHFSPSYRQQNKLETRKFCFGNVSTGIWWGTEWKIVENWISVRIWDWNLNSRVSHRKTVVLADVFIDFSPYRDSHNVYKPIVKCPAHPGIWLAQPGGTNPLSNRSAWHTAMSLTLSRVPL